MDDLIAFQSRAKDWVSRFCALRNRRMGYQRTNVTPCMHDFTFLVYHQLQRLEEHSLKPFSCSVVEKKNDFARMVTLWHSNNHKAAHDVFLACEREAYLQRYKRETRAYKPRQGAVEAADGGETHLKPCPAKPTASPEQASAGDAAADAARAAMDAAASEAFALANQLPQHHHHEATQSRRATKRRRSEPPVTSGNHSARKRKKT